MLYRITRPFATIAFYVCFRKIHMSHAERIPWGKPVILAANHPSAFLEPCLLACWLPRPLYFLARGNLFDNPVFAALLRSWHLVPVYRAEESGFSAVRQNYESFAYCYRTLQQGKPVMILAEGRTAHEKRLRPLKKGTARVAFGALTFDPSLDLYVVPVGVNYTDALRWRTEAMIDFGEPIRVRDYLEAYEAHPGRAMAAFTETLRARLEPRVITIEDAADDTWVEQLLEMDRHNRGLSVWPPADRDDSPLLREKAITRKVNALSASDKAALEKRVTDWQRTLARRGQTDLGVAQPGWACRRVRGALLASALPAALGALFHVLPLRLGKYVADTQVVRPEFKLSVTLGVALGATLSWYLLWTIGLWLAGGWAAVLWLWVLAPLSGVVAVWRRDVAGWYRQAKAFKSLAAEEQQALLRQRRALLDFFFQLGRPGQA